MTLMNRKVMEEAREYVDSKFNIPKSVFSEKDSLDAINYLLLNFKQQPFEQFGCVFLDADYCVIETSILFNGSINTAHVYPRIVAQKALDLSTKSVLVFHNHPSGDTAPSQADKDLTLRLIKTLSYLDMFVVDHIILGGKNSHSFLLNQTVEGLNHVPK